METTLTIHHPVGLHARPASVFVQTAKKFTSKISICMDDKEVNAKSILNVLALGANQGSVIRLVVEGEDAEAALKTLTELVESNFGGVD
ncbi:HPr family phosphocarrier protein [bacterium]|nr:HPr family phosphocarrier protein [bacterium]